MPKYVHGVVYLGPGESPVPDLHGDFVQRIKSPIYSNGEIVKALGHPNSAIIGKMDLKLKADSPASLDYVLKTLSEQKFFPHG
jgi:hypothetical protein